MGAPTAPPPKWRRWRHQEWSCDCCGTRRTPARAPRAAPARWLRADAGCPTRTPTSRRPSRTSSRCLPRSTPARRSGRPEPVSVLIIGIGLFALSTVPYLVAYLTAPGDHVFNGFFYLADDANTYLSKMREGAEGAWLWTDRYISSPVPTPVF